MDILAGITKIWCYDNRQEDRGKTIRLSNGYQNFDKIIESNNTEFLIPTMPAPERKGWSVAILNNGVVEFSESFKPSYGDFIEIIMDNAHKTAHISDINSINTQMQSLEQRLAGRISYGTSDKVDGSSTLNNGYLYCYIG